MIRGGINIVIILIPHLSIITLLYEYLKFLEKAIQKWKKSKHTQELNLI